MKALSELGISPAPWLYSKSIGAILSDAHGVVYDEQMLANDARLIAAAPEMYECLREAIVQTCLYCKYKKCEECKIVNKWKVAIAKASGEEVTND